jgi:hypothetical protein
VQTTITERPSKSFYGKRKVVRREVVVYVIVKEYLDDGNRKLTKTVYEPVVDGQGELLFIDETPAGRTFMEFEESITG